MTITHQIEVSAVIDQPVQTVWDAFTTPEDITQWNQASEDWHCPEARQDLRVGGRFSSLMAAKDGSMQFEFSGEYTKVEPAQRYEYRLDDGRMVSVDFEAVTPEQTRLTERFDPEQMNPLEMQQAGWQAILDGFKSYVEKK